MQDPFFYKRFIAHINTLDTMRDIYIRQAVWY